MDTYKPKTRSTHLLLEELPDELVIYDVERNQAHCLNGTAMRVWALCDGERTVSEIAGALNMDLDTEATETLVWCALDQFTENHLLDSVENQPANRDRQESVARRQVLLRLGLVVGLLPLVESIVSPEAALAQSGGTGNTPITP
jgi:hypothetical protein